MPDDRVRGRAGVSSSATFSKDAADVDRNGSVTILDAAKIQRWLAGIGADNNIGKPF